VADETIGKTIAVAIGVCGVCSVLVSTAAVYLGPIQNANKTTDKKRNVLVAAGLAEEGERLNVEELFQQIDARWIDVDTGEFVDKKDIPAEAVDETTGAKNPEWSRAIDDDIAGIQRRARYRQVYFTRKGADVDRIILPVHGKGLWSTLYGFLALDPDTTTIESLAFYDHGETPGLGGEVDNPRWKASWVGKKAFDAAWKPAIRVVKGSAPAGTMHDVDGLSGATITGRGVQNLLWFWLGDEGYGPFLEKWRNQR